MHWRSCKYEAFRIMRKWSHKFMTSDQSPSVFVFRQLSNCRNTMEAADSPRKDSPATPEENSTKKGLRTVNGVQYDFNDPRFAGMGTRAIKRLLKQEHWEATRDERTKIQREKQRRKKEERQKLVEEGVLEPRPKRQRHQEMSLSNVGVVIDCAFTSYMSEKELHSMQSQIVHCYSKNRTAPLSMKTSITSFDEALRTTFDKKTSSWTNWKNVDFLTETYDEKFDKDNLIYLSADSDNVAHELEDGKTYIIGGIVDKNRYKGLCQNKAVEQGIKTAQLPIGEYIHMASRKVLTVNQVYEIMLKWLEYRDWKRAFMDVIPLRKLKESVIVDPKQEEAGSEEQKAEKGEAEEAIDAPQANEDDADSKEKEATT
ncbi:guanine-1-methyltransferase-domain-containing protein [Radiomyces spectabilis]|uniref:guanine-1-methyltransferase-domain-containing protein n=1 Tax=Radiomyces spectabilis TaxID=64574 RepID=UPI00221FDB94|nr:guanine-1-methyltransferase-domain-containing protein [Radiomyces spectabilis]KAI8369311.1 guanine-1-methyltransferase-domain-containing protein [Radiomyces spectabilis]